MGCCIYEISEPSYLHNQGSLYAIAVDPAPARHFMRFPALAEDIRDILSQNQIKSKPTICTWSCHLVFVPWSNYLGPGPFDFTSHSKGFAGWFELVEPSTGRVRKWAPWVGHSCSSDTSNRYSISSACASAGISYNTHLASFTETKHTPRNKTWNSCSSDTNRYNISSASPVHRPEYNTTPIWHFKT